MFLRHILVYKNALFVIFVYFENTVHCNKDCWKSYDVDQLFDVMQKIDARKVNPRASKQMRLANVAAGVYTPDCCFVRQRNDCMTIDEEMMKQYSDVKYSMEGMQQETDSKIQSKFHDHSGKAIREEFKVFLTRYPIPTGINLGGYSMLRLPKSLLFFHRMKLREHQSSAFRLKSLNTSMVNLQIQAHMKLYDLSLYGSFDIANIIEENKTKSILSYDPTFGQVELLLKNVSYKIDARTRFLNQRLFVELIISEIDLDKVLMVYGNKESSNSASLQRKDIDAFIDRLKVDLDKWIKDYLTDIIANNVADFPKDAKYEEYHQQRTIALNQYADRVIEKLRERLNNTNNTVITLPDFELRNNIATVSLYYGQLRGLDSIYRRSIATGLKHNDSDVYNVNTVVGFSTLELSCSIKVVLNSLKYPEYGEVSLTADDLTARMDLSLTKNQETVDLSFTFLEQAKPEFLSIRGNMLKQISNLKYILEHHVIAIMTANLMDSIQKLGTLDQCFHY